MGICRLHNVQLTPFQWSDRAVSCPLSTRLHPLDMAYVLNVIDGPIAAVTRSMTAAGSRRGKNDDYAGGDGDWLHSCRGSRHKSLVLRRRRLRRDGEEWKGSKGGFPTPPPQRRAESLPTFIPPADCSVAAIFSPYLPLPVSPQNCGSDVTRICGQYPMCKAQGRQGTVQLIGSPIGALQYLHR